MDNYTDDIDMVSAVDHVSDRLAIAFATTWASEQGETIMRAFISGQARFIIEANRFVVIPISDDDPPDDDALLTGQYL